MHFNRSPRRVVRHALVDPRVAVVSALHQKVNAGRFGLLGDDGNAVAWTAEGYFLPVVKPSDLGRSLGHVRNGAAQVDHGTDVDEDVRPADDGRRGF